MANFYLHTCDSCGYQIETSASWPIVREKDGVKKCQGSYARLYCPVCDEVFPEVVISDKEKAPDLCWWVNLALNYLPIERHHEIYRDDHYFRKRNKKPVLCPKCSRATLVLEGVGKKCCEIECPRCHEGKMISSWVGHVKFAQ